MLSRHKIHQLIDMLSEEELQQLWPQIQQFYYDHYVLKAIEAGAQQFKPGDTLTREEALEFLSHS